jgi:uncharacterized membrane protein YqjE
MITNGRARNQEPNVAASVSELTHDVIELAELQAQLLALDIKATSQKSRTSLLLAAIGICVLLGSIPVVLFALAELFVAQFEWSPAAGFAVAALVGVLLSALFLVAGWYRFKSGFDTLARSREEFSRNLTWIKSTLRSRGRPNATGYPCESDVPVPTPKPDY